MNTRAQAPNRRVLVVEDEESIRLVLTLMLTDAGFDVSEASDGAEGLELLQRERFDLTVTDISMPIKDGLTMIEEAAMLVQEARFIVYTGSDYNDPRIAGRLKRDNIVNVLHKPMKMSCLVAAVQEAVSEAGCGSYPIPRAELPWTRALRCA